MPRARSVVFVLILGLYLCLAAPVATAAEHRAPASRGHRAFLIVPESLQGFLVSIWSKTGCHIDPLGRCSQDHATTGAAPPPSSGGSATANLDEGCAIDPWGACVRNR